MDLGYLTIYIMHSTTAFTTVSFSWLIFQALNNLKHQLSTVLTHGETLRREIADRDRQAERFQGEYTAASQQFKKAEKTFQRLKFQQEDMYVHDIPISALSVYSLLAVSLAEYIYQASNKACWA